ncbi:DUF4351 domain-containing protein [Alloalcanivorax mobilis]|uniref:DUF4351 domain-containing protein n=1 Tax=Alloalcanivorax mobilis TaxID=2019569 RepID=UPI000B5B17CB|nr:DUF4351 domain-containing protein [Alloalcanivorax mobilis]ASK34841.1 cytosolic protein [Alcanivorax sp. N3-2A]|tara:strand:+ start:6656 stop:7606 length:951 start_codon:yes stop_codon:yes gene_type:complete
MTQDQYDSPWKEAIEIMLPDFIAFYFPGAWRAIDWQQPYRFLDQELQKIVPESHTGRRVVDKLVEVALVCGRGEQWIHLHIEIQSSPEADFAERMMIYHYRIFDRFRRPVASLAMLADSRPGWRPGPYRQSVLGCNWTLEYPSVKLLDYRRGEKTLASSDNPFGLVTLAHLRTQGTRNQSARRYRAKYRLIRLLYGRGWEKRRIIQLLRIIDWLMALPPHLEQSLRQRLITVEGERHMQYVTSFERLAKQEGRQEGHQEGRQEGGRDLLLRLLERRFGALPDAIENQIRDATSEQLNAWADRVLDADCLEAVFRHL